jgi:hypothetical protein
MASTTVDLYRRGNTTSARLDNVRQQDVTIFQQNGVDWVQGRSGGVSTFATNPPPGSGKVWHLPSGNTYPPELYVWNDHGDHWSWEPDFDMPFADYRSALASVNGNFQ